MTAGVHVDIERHPIDDPAYAQQCRKRLDADGALVLGGFLRSASLDAIVAESSPRETDAYYASSTHNVYLTPPDPGLADDHPFNRQIVSSKGLIADDQVATDSPLRDVYDDSTFRSFVAAVVGVGAVHPYADDLSSINVHFAPHGRELGWHFDNSSFAITLLLRAPEDGGRFEYVPAVRNSATDDLAFGDVAAVLDGDTPTTTLQFEPGDLVLFRGRDAMHRVTPTVGETTRLLAVFAFNDEPGVALSKSALATFYGRGA